MANTIEIVHVGGGWYELRDSEGNVLEKVQGQEAAGEAKARLLGRAVEVETDGETEVASSEPAADAQEPAQAPKGDASSEEKFDEASPDEPTDEPTDELVTVDLKQNYRWVIDGVSTELQKGRRRIPRRVAVEIGLLKE